MRSPAGRRSIASVPRRVAISFRASLMSAQIFVPASMTDCIISGLICSPSRGRAAARRVSEWLRSWPSASTSWNSSSIPIVSRWTLVRFIAPLREHRRHKEEGREYREEKEEHVHRTEERPQAAWCALPDDLLSRGEHQAHVAPSTTYVGTTLPAPAVTLRRALDETRASVPE